MVLDQNNENLTNALELSVSTYQSQYDYESILKIITTFVNVSKKFKYNFRNQKVLKKKNFRKFQKILIKYYIIKNSHQLKMFNKQLQKCYFIVNQQVFSNQSLMKYIRFLLLLTFFQDQLFLPFTCLQHLSSLVCLINVILNFY